MRFFIVLFGVMFIAGCGPANRQMGNGPGPAAQPTAAMSPADQTDAAPPKENDCKICDFDFATYKGDLKKEEIDGLLLALNDEYLAWATYGGVRKEFQNPRPFSNIQQAEAKHIERLKQVFEAYKVPVPENTWVGNAPKFASVDEACKAGVDAEIANRDLYTKLFNTTDREDILIVYRALQSASENNHLPAFQRCGGGGGGRN